jgi:hypothetical protein
MMSDEKEIVAKCANKLCDTVFTRGPEWLLGNCCSEECFEVAMFGLELLGKHSKNFAEKIKQKLDKLRADGVSEEEIQEWLNEEGE